MIFHEFQAVIAFFMWLLLIASGLTLIATLFLDWSKATDKMKGAASGMAMLFGFAALALIVI